MDISLPARRLLVAVLLASLAALALACTGEERIGEDDAVAPLYLAIGASDAVGTGARNPATEGWVPQVHARMPAGTRMANLGISGLRIHQALDQVLPVALDLQPTVVVVWLAANDLVGGVPLEAYRADLDLLLGSLTRGTTARVYVANLPDLTVLPSLRERPRDDLREQVAHWNEAIARSAETNGAVLVDLYTGWSELRERRDYISADGFHPSSRGYRRMADLFWQAMQGT